MMGGRVNCTRSWLCMPMRTRSSRITIKNNVLNRSFAFIGTKLRGRYAMALAGVNRLMSNDENGTMNCGLRIAEGGLWMSKFRNPQLTAAGDDAGEDSRAPENMSIATKT